MILGISLYRFQSVFNLSGSCYPYLEARHFLTSLGLVIWTSSNPCGAGLPGGKYRLDNSTIPFGIFSRALCRAICALYYDHGDWFVYSCKFRYYLIKLLVPSQSSVNTHVHRIDRWFKGFLESVFPCKSIFLEVEEREVDPISGGSGVV